MSITYEEARAEIARRAAEFLAGVASGGSTSTVVDTTNLHDQDGYWAESTILMTSGTNDQRQRRVSNFTGSTSTLTLYSNLGAAVASGDTYELYRRFTPADILVATNRSLNIAAPDFRERVVAVITATMDTLSYTCPTGPDVDGRNVVALEYQKYTNATQSTWPYERLDPRLWEIREDFVTDRTVKTLQLNFNPETNRLLRFIYDGPLGNVASPTDVIRLDLPELEWLYTQATCELWRMEAGKTTDANRRAALEQTARWEANADRLRRQLAQARRQSPLRRSTFEVTL